MTEVLNMSDPEQGLTITLDPGHNCKGDNVWLYVVPPLSSEETQTLAEHEGGDSTLSGLLDCNLGDADDGTLFVIEETPGEQHETIGIELAKMLLSQRGLQTAVVNSKLGGKNQSYVIKDQR